MSKEEYDKQAYYMVNRIRDYKEFIDNTHDYEVYLQDDCANPKFNLIPKNFENFKYSGFYD